MTGIDWKRHMSCCRSFYYFSYMSVIKTPSSSIPPAYRVSASTSSGSSFACCCLSLRGSGSLLSYMSAVKRRNISCVGLKSLQQPRDVTPNLILIMAASILVLILFRDFTLIEFMKLNALSTAAFDSGRLSARRAKSEILSNFGCGISAS